MQHVRQPESDRRRQGYAARMVDEADETPREEIEVTRAKQYPIPEPGKACLSLAETCGLVGAGMTTVRKAIDTGQLPARKLGKRVIVLRADVDQFLKNLPSTRA